MTIGTLIREARKAAGWSQQELVKHAAISQQYLSNIENDHVDVSLRIVLRIAKELDLDLNQLKGD